MDRPKLFLVIAFAIMFILFVALVYALLAGNIGDSAHRETLYQVSTIEALQQGVFDGIQPVGELRQHGDFGIGTFDALNGEMIVLEGIVYQATADGRVSVIPDTTTTPFATVTYFENDFTIATIEPMNFSAFMSEMTQSRMTCGSTAVKSFSRACVASSRQFRTGIMGEKPTRMGYPASLHRFSPRIRRSSEGVSRSITRHTVSVESVQ